jgi:hypothetical protein
MESTSSASSRSKTVLRNNRFYKKFKSYKKNRGDKKDQSNVQSQSLENFEQHDGDEQHRKEEEIDRPDNYGNREALDGRANFGSRESLIIPIVQNDFEPFEDVGQRQVTVPEHEYEYQYRPNDVVDGNKDEDSDYRRKEKKRREKERKRYEAIKQDVVAMNAKVDPLIREIKAIKSIIRRWDAPPQPGTDEEDETDQFEELPPFPLKKRKSVLLMETNATANRTYKKQLVSLNLYKFECKLQHCFIVFRLPSYVRLVELISRKML